MEEALSDNSFPKKETWTGGSLEENTDGLPGEVGEEGEIRQVKDGTKSEEVNAIQEKKKEVMVGETPQSWRRRRHETMTQGSEVRTV